MIKSKQNESLIQELELSKLQPKIKGAWLNKNYHDMQQLPLNKIPFNHHVGVCDITILNDFRRQKKLKLELTKQNLNIITS